MFRGLAREGGITLRQIGLQKRNYQEVISNETIGRQEISRPNYSGCHNSVPFG